MIISEFIETVISEIGLGVSKGNEALNKNNIGGVYYDNIKTMGADLVNLQLAKDNVGAPVLIVNFKIQVAVNDTKASSDATSMSAKATLLSVIGIGGNISADSESSKTSSSTHSITFSIPIKLHNKVMA